MIKASNNPFECSPSIIGSGQPNALISLGPIERVGNNFSIPALGVAYRISGTVHSNLDAFAFTIAPENVLNRIDWIVGTPTGIQHLVGEPFLDIVTSPAISDPENTVLIKEYKIEGSNVDEGETPVIGGDYITKSSRRDNFIGATGENVLLPEPSDKVGFRLIAPGLISIDGILYGGFGSAITIGDFIPITNVTGNSIPLNHGSSFITDNYVLPNQKVAIFRYEGSGVYRLAAVSVGGVPTLQAVTEAGATTTEAIIITRPSPNFGALFTNAQIYAGGLNSPIRLSNSSTQGYDLSRFMNNVRVHRKMQYIPDDSEPIPIVFDNDNDIPSRGYNNSIYATIANLALKANLAGGNNYTGVQMTDNKFAVNRNVAGISNSLLLKNNNTDNNSGSSIEFEGFFKSAKITSTSIPQVSQYGNLQIQPYFQNDVYRIGIFLQGSTGNTGINTISPTEILDVNGNVKLSGVIFLGQFTDGTEPAYQKGVTYFNVSINKMKIGGATAWETITSI